MGIGLEWPQVSLLERLRVSLLEHPLPCRVWWCVQRKVEQDSVTPEGHQLALSGCSC